MTGSVIEVLVSDGDAVSRGDILVLVESMKMEMPIEAPAAGVVAEVRVTEGQTVDEGAVLVVID